MIFGRRGGKRALLEWAVNTWQDWGPGHGTRYQIPGAEFDVCPVCYFRWDVAATEDPLSYKRLWVLIQSAPLLDGPFCPDGPFKARGCRCWRGLTDNEARCER